MQTLAAQEFTHQTCPHHVQAQDSVGVAFTTYSQKDVASIIQSWMTSKTAHKPRNLPARATTHTQRLKSALWPFWWLA